MKLTNTTSELIAKGGADFAYNDRLGRAIGAHYWIKAEVFVEVDASIKYPTWNASECLTGPGMYYNVTTANTRNGRRYQASTSKLFATLAEAQAYADAFVSRKAKDAPKKAGK
jgi:hypothetical protein